jgi:hypothetical protein
MYIKTCSTTLQTSRVWLDSNYDDLNPVLCNSISTGDERYTSGKFLPGRTVFQKAPMVGALNTIHSIACVKHS